MGVIDEMKRRSSDCTTVQVVKRCRECPKNAKCRRLGKCPRTHMGCCKNNLPCTQYPCKKRFFDMIEMGPNMEIDNLESDTDLDFGNTSYVISGA